MQNKPRDVVVVRVSEQGDREDENFHSPKAQLAKARVWSAPSVWRIHDERLELEPKTIEAAALRHTSDGRLLIEIRGNYREAPGELPVVRGAFVEWLRVATFGEETVVT
jgi:hypothetical protein